MKILGVPEKGRASTILRAELQKIGFRTSDLEFITEIPEEGEHFVLAVGSDALSACGDNLRMSDVSGQILTAAENPDCLVVPNYAPGFLYHNPNMKGLWVDNLKLAWIAYNLDEKGVVV